jgi:hypothetical protein
MAATATVPAVAKPSLEQKIVDAADQSAQIVAAFSPQAAVLIKTGVAVEPIISGIAHIIAGLFRHHTSQAK